MVASSTKMARTLLGMLRYAQTVYERRDWAAVPTGEHNLQLSPLQCCDELAVKNAAECNKTSPRLK